MTFKTIEAGVFYTIHCTKCKLFRIFERDTVNSQMLRIPEHVEQMKFFFVKVICTSLKNAGEASYASILLWTSIISGCLRRRRKQANQICRNRFSTANLSRSILLGRPHLNFKILWQFRLGKLMAHPPDNLLMSCASGCCMSVFTKSTPILQGYTLIVTLCRTLAIFMQFCIASDWQFHKHRGIETAFYFSRAYAYSSEHAAGNVPSMQLREDRWKTPNRTFLFNAFNTKLPSVGPCILNHSSFFPTNFTSYRLAWFRHGYPE